MRFRSWLFAAVISGVLTALVVDLGGFPHTAQALGLTTAVFAACAFITLF